MALRSPPSRRADPIQLRLESCNGQTLSHCPGRRPAGRRRLQLLGVRSPAPPTIALVGLLGILLGEQVVPIAKRLTAGRPVAEYLRTSCAEHVLGRLPGDDRADG